MSVDAISSDSSNGEDDSGEQSSDVYYDVVTEDRSDQETGAKPDPEEMVSVPSSTSTSGEARTPDESIKAHEMESRPYQIEMLHKSLENNTIVAMDTGSGKTQVALLRIQEEIKTCAAEKIIWFLAPTVLLSSQQCEVIRLHIPSVTTRLLTGNENVDTWEAAIWTAVLSSSRIIVSTPQVLHDALVHAFVSLDRLALLIFDEAHNCVGKAAGSKIMTEFYHPRKQRGHSVPSILGLTASPSMRSTAEDIKKLEKVLDARCASPTLHRQELLKHVKKPQMFHVDYECSRSPIFTEAIMALRRVYFGLDLKDDPYILKLAADPTDRNRRALMKAIEKSDTFVQNQLKGLFSRSLELLRELGTWAADHYLWTTIAGYVGQVHSEDEFFSKYSEEKKYLAKQLRNVELTEPSKEPDDISDKAKMLLQELVSTPDSPVCIIFARERATVSMLYELLTKTPAVTTKYRIGAVVGTSNHTGKKRNIYDDLNNIKLDLSVLQKFRSGQLNLLVATSVLEEGIDVPACNLVICFDDVLSLKAFVQRRGRARMRDSRLLLFMEKSAGVTKQWEAMEAQLKRQYQDEERERQHLESLEQGDEKSEKNFEVESTGAKLGLDEAKQHLEHFCRALSQGEFVDSRPDYIIHHNWDEHGMTISATVLLPPFLPAQVRQAESRFRWTSEKNATKDAAFHAYIALYKAGLVNDHLLPYKPSQIPGVDARPPVAAVGSAFKPWESVSQAWSTAQDRWAYTFTCYDENDQVLGEYDIMIPIEVHQPRPMRLYMDYKTQWSLHSTEGRLLSKADAKTMPDHTSALICLVFGHRWQVHEKPHVIQVSARHNPFTAKQIGYESFDVAFDAEQSQRYLIRDTLGVPYIYQGVLEKKPPFDQVRRPFLSYEEGPDDCPYLLLKKWTKRADFLHPLLSDPSKEAASEKPYHWVFPVPWARLDAIPIEHAHFATFLPSIIHELEINILVKHLAENLLAPVGIGNYELIRQAISARSAREPLNYERLEFIGDSILKYCVAVLAASLHTEWPEGYLSLFKDGLVSNSRLFRASVDTGLSRYILTKQFTGQKWRPLYREAYMEPTSAKSGRQLSSKVVADVVESLIGAAYQDGGIDKATKCIAVFLDEQEWPTTAESRQKLYDLQAQTLLQSDFLAPLEELLGHTFQKKTILLEALTHASHASFMVGNVQRSLERLEFLGDAVLDNIVVTKLFAIQPPLSHDKMHLLKTSLVNGDFLAFLTFENGIYREEAEITDDLDIEKKNAFKPLWTFMRHASTSIALEQAATSKRYAELREDIYGALQTGTYYPWALLAKLQARKFFSDVVESLLGAIWVDSGSLEACEAFVSRLGIFSYLERFIRDQVEVQHPKERIGMRTGNLSVKYKVEVTEKANGDKEFACAVHVGDRVVARVENGVNKEEVKTKAAAEALTVLQEETEAMEIDD